MAALTLIMLLIGPVALAMFAAEDSPRLGGVNCLEPVGQAMGCESTLHSAHN